MFSPKVGLFAVLLLGVSDQHLLLGDWTIPNTLAAIWILPIIYLLFKVKTTSDRPISSLSLVILLMAAMILTHTITAMCMSILLLVFWLGFEAYSKLYREKAAVPASFWLFSFFSVAMFGWWMYVSGHISTLRELISQGFARAYWQRAETLVDEVAEYISNVPVSEQLFNNLGMYLFFSLSFIGCLYMVSKMFGSKYSLTLAIGSMVILALGFLPSVTGRSIIAQRWHYFSEILLAIPLGLVLLLLCQLPRSKTSKIILLSSLVFNLTFLMIMSPSANTDNPTFSPHTEVRFSYSESELQAMDTISSMSDRVIASDSLCFNPLTYKYNARFAEIDRSLYYGEFVASQDRLVMIREEVVDYPFYASGGVLRLENDPRPALAEQGFSCVYDCGTVNGYLK